MVCEDIWHAPNGVEEEKVLVELRCGLAWTSRLESHYSVWIVVSIDDCLVVGGMALSTGLYVDVWRSQGSKKLMEAVS